ncbi:hypothetical protein [Allomuricauda sp. F6463D]|nr:hypothetical protein [Muricauda sp. F6463D]
MLRNSRPLDIRPNALLNQIAKTVGTGSPSAPLLKTVKTRTNNT